MGLIYAYLLMICSWEAGSEQKNMAADMALCGYLSYRHDARLIVLLPWHSIANDLWMMLIPQSAGYRAIEEPG